MISNPLADHEQIIRSLRTDADRCEEYHDMGTNDFLISVMEKHEKMDGCYVLTWTGYTIIHAYY
jgi:starvation-inducible DNA-binding protein